MCFKCGRLGHRKEHCPHVVRQGSANSEAGVKEAGETCFSSRSTHVLDEARCEEGTSGVMHDSEQSTEQADVYGPWIVVERRKNGTKPLRSVRTSPWQNYGMNIRTKDYVEKGSVDRVAMMDGL